MLNTPIAGINMHQKTDPFCLCRFENHCLKIVTREFEAKMPEPGTEKPKPTPSSKTTKERLAHTNISPTSPLSTHTTDKGSTDISINSHNSIDQLCNNVCEMESSDHSPSRFSYVSYGQESRIDSELRYLADGGLAKTDTSKSETGDENEPTESRVSGDEKESDGSDVTTRKNKKTRPPSPAKSSSSGKIPKPSPMKKPGSKLTVKKNEKNPNTEDPRYLGQYLLKQARELVQAGDDPNKALDLAIRAKKSFESCLPEKPDLEFVMCLHMVAALYCILRQYDKAIPVVERSIEITNINEGQKHLLAKFAGCMQLGDTYAMQGNIEKSLLCYKAALEIQKHVLGEYDARFGETCRYVAEAHVQAMQFDEAKKLCKMAIDIHGKNGTSNSLEEAADRRLMGLICDSTGNYETAIEYYVLARMAMSANGHDSDSAAIDVCIGDAYLSLARYDEAIFTYQKALNVFRFTKGDNHSSVASVYVRLADLYNKIGKFRESETYCEHALRIYIKPNPKSSSDEIANGLIEVSAIYESMNELDQALDLLKKSLKAYGTGPGQVTAVAGVEAQIGVLCYMMGSYFDSYGYFKNAITKFRVAGEKKSGVFGVTLNQMGLACVQIESFGEAADLFEEARSVLETEYGPHHPNTLGVYTNLAGTYDAMGRYADFCSFISMCVLILALD